LRDRLGQSAQASAGAATINSSAITSPRYEKPRRWAGVDFEGVMLQVPLVCTVLHMGRRRPMPKPLGSQSGRNKWQNVTLHALL